MTLTDGMLISSHACAIGKDEGSQNFEENNSQVLFLEEGRKIGNFIFDFLLLFIGNIDHDQIIQTILKQYIYFINLSSYKCQLTMEPNNTSRSTIQRKTSYFQKYRHELDRISEEIKHKNQNTYTNTQTSDNIKNSKIFNTQVKMAKSHHVPTIQTSARKGIMFESTKEPRKQSLQDIELNLRQSQATKELQLLMEQLEAAKSKMQQTEAQIAQKHTTIQYLTKQIARQSSQIDNQQIISYAEKILAIQARMKFKKELHQDQLHRIVNQKNAKHSENVQLSKFIEQLEEQLSNLAQQHEKSQKQEPIALLKGQALQIQNQVIQLTRECAQIQKKINNSEQLKGISLNEFKRYSEVYKRQLIGKEIAQTEDRIKQRNNQKRYLVDIERKKCLIKQKKVENMVRQKSVIEVERVIKFTNKQIQQLKKELALLNIETKSIRQE